MNIKHFIVSTIVTGFVLLLSGCNTVQGFGKDMQSGGKEIQKAANQ